MSTARLDPRAPPTSPVAQLDRASSSSAGSTTTCRGGGAGCSMPSYLSHRLELVHPVYQHGPRLLRAVPPTDCVPPDHLRPPAATRRARGLVMADARMSSPPEVLALMPFYGTLVRGRAAASHILFSRPSAVRSDDDRKTKQTSELGLPPGVSLSMWCRVRLPGWLLSAQPRTCMPSSAHRYCTTAWNSSSSSAPSFLRTMTLRPRQYCRNGWYTG